MPHRLADIGPGICRKLGIAFVFLGVIAICGCYHVRVIVPQPDPGTEYNKKKTVQNLAWGMLPKKTRDIPAKNCLNSTGLDEVRVSSNLGYSFLTVGTLGFWSPAQIEWRCTKPFEPPDDVIHKRKPVSLVLGPAPQAGSAPPSGRKTIHTLAWGLVAQNAVADNCAKSKAMDEVRVNSNFGYSLVNVATLGFWSPTTVEWKCSSPREQSGMVNPDSLLQSQTGLESR
jgi:hypothetical protein